MKRVFFLLAAFLPIISYGQGTPWTKSTANTKTNKQMVDSVLIVPRDTAPSNTGLYPATTGTPVGDSGRIAYQFGKFWGHYGALGWQAIGSDPDLSNYYTKLESDGRYPLLSGSYSNPSWISSLTWPKITGTPTTLSGYGITDAVPSSRTLNMVGGTDISITGGTQNLSANRTWTFNDISTFQSVALRGRTTTTAIGIKTTDTTEALNMGGSVLFNMGGSLVSPIVAPKWAVKWHANTDTAYIYMQSTGDQNGSSNLVFEMADNRTSSGGSKEGFIFKKSGSGDVPPEPDYELLTINEDSTTFFTKVSVQGAAEVTNMIDVGGANSGGYRASGGNPANYGWFGLYRATGQRDFYFGSSPYGRIDMTMENGANILIQGGRVGINETSPAAPMHVTGTSSTTGNAFIAGNSLGTEIIKAANNGVVTLNGLSYTSGSGSPEGTITAPVGSWYSDLTNGVPYFKKTGSGNTGWKAVTLAP